MSARPTPTSIGADPAGAAASAVAAHAGATDPHGDRAAADAALTAGMTSRQPLDADLTALAALAGTGYARRTGADAWTLDTPAAGVTSVAGRTGAVVLTAADVAGVAPAPGVLAAVTTTVTVTPTAVGYTQPPTMDALAIYAGAGDYTRPEISLYVRIDAGPVREVRVGRLTRTVLAVPGGSAVAFGTAEGRPLVVAPLAAVVALTSPAAVTGTAAADDADPLLWEPAAPHVTLPAAGGRLTLVAPTAGDKLRTVLVREQDDAGRWSPTYVVTLHTDHTGDVTLPLACRRVALATTDGGPLTVRGPAGTVVGGVSTRPFIALPAAEQVVTVTAGSETDLRAKLTAATAGTHVLLPPGTYTLTAAWPAVAAGVVVRSSVPGTPAVVVLAAMATPFEVTTAGLWLRDLSFDGTAITTSAATPGLFRFTGGAVVRAESCRFLGPLPGPASPPDLTQTVSVAGRTIDILYHRCEFRGGNDLVSLDGSGTAGVVLVRCTTAQSGVASSAQHLTTHFSLANTIRAVACTLTDAADFVVLSLPQGGDTRLEFCIVRPGTRKCQIRDASLYRCWVQGVTQTIARAGGFSLGTILETADSLGGNGVLGVYGDQADGTQPRCSYVRTNDGTVSTVAGPLTRAVTFEFVTASAPPGGNIVLGYGPAQVVMYRNVTLSSVPSGGNGINATGVATAAAFFKARNAITPGCSTGIYAPGTSLDDDYCTVTGGGTGPTGANSVTATPGVDARLVPVAGGNCDNTGDGTLYPWVGGRDYCGWPLIYAPGVVPRGARSRPQVAPAAAVLPDQWPAIV